MNLTEAKLPTLMPRIAGCTILGAYTTNDGLTIIKSLDQMTDGSLLHVSVSREDRDPTEDEIKEVISKFFTGSVEITPSVSPDAHCYHVWQELTEPDEEE